MPLPIVAVSDTAGAELRQRRFAKATAGLVLNVRTGEVLALASLPDYEPNARTLSPGDSISMAISAFNTTARPVDIRFSVSTEGGISVSAPPSSLSIGANQESYTLAGLRAGQRLGKATVKVKTSSSEGEIESSTDLPVRLSP